MVFIFGILGLVLAYGALILPWVNRSRISYLNDELETLRTRLKKFEREATAAPREKTAFDSSIASSTLSTPTPEEDAAEISFNTPAMEVETGPWYPRSTWSAPLPPEPTPEPVPEPQPAVRMAELREASRRKAEEKAGFEVQFGTKLPVWIGGIALALAGFYLVKYSIDIGLLSPAVRLIIGVFFGGGLLKAAEEVRKKDNFANGTRISQALTGAGIADLYVCIFAATSVYHLIPAVLGFIGMAAVTAGAVLLSVRHGMPIALLGMVGGFLTPALMGSDQPSAFLLFTYLYVLVAGLMAIIRKQGQWTLAVLTTAAAFLWVVAWAIGGHFAAYDAGWVCLFILAVIATLFGTSTFDRAAETAADEQDTLNMLNNGATIAGLLLMGLVMSKSGYGMMEWGLFWLLSAGTMGMAYFRHEVYRLLPWTSLVMNGLMIYSCNNEALSLSFTISAFALLYTVGGQVLQAYSNKRLYWGSLATAALTGFYTLAYMMLRDQLAMDLAWSLMGFSFASLGLHFVKETMQTADMTQNETQNLVTVYIAGVTALVSLALMIGLGEFYFVVALALEVLVLAWISTRAKIPSLRPITGIVGGVFTVMMIKELLQGLNVLLHALIETPVHAYALVSDGALFQLGVSAGCFIAAATVLCRQKDDLMVKYFEAMGVILTALTGYNILHHIFSLDGDAATISFMQRGLTTNIIFLAGFAALAAGKRLNRSVFVSAGMLMSMMALFRIGFLDLIIHNPIADSSQDVGSWPLINNLLLTFGAPIVWSLNLMRMAPDFNREHWIPKLGGSALALSFLLVTYEVRQFFHGAILTGAAQTAEIYAYSAVWLIFGLALLFFGTIKELKMVRVASLCIMVLTVGKVFLYDASELTGLLRIFSFLGLGLSLIGLSWFYSRFILSQSKE